jgi:dCMP deaminase
MTHASFGAASEREFYHNDGDGGLDSCGLADGGWADMAAIDRILSWDEYFMGVAALSARRSKDPHTQVGACIVGSDQRILSIGYNGTPRGMSDATFPWEREGTALSTKYPYVIHAERNAVLNFRGLMREFVGSTVYVTHYPCNECAKELAQVGVGTVVFALNPYPDSDETRASERILSAAGIVVRQVNVPEITLG